MGHDDTEMVFASCNCPGLLSLYQSATVDRETFGTGAAPAATATRVITEALIGKLQHLATSISRISQPTLRSLDTRAAAMCERFKAEADAARSQMN